MTKLRIDFERDYGCSNWHTERELRIRNGEKALPYVPDARFQAADGQAWSLEVERTSKRAERLRGLLDARARASRSSKLLYILDRRFFEHYRGLIAVTVNPGAFHLICFDDLVTVYVGADNWRAQSLSTVLLNKKGSLYV